MRRLLDRPVKDFRRKAERKRDTGKNERNERDEGEKVGVKRGVVTGSPSEEFLHPRKEP